MLLCRTRKKTRPTAGPKNYYGDDAYLGLLPVVLYTDIINPWVLQLVLPRLGPTLEPAEWKQN